MFTSFTQKNRVVVEIVLLFLLEGGRLRFCQLYLELQGDVHPFTMEPWDMYKASLDIAMSASVLFLIHSHSFPVTLFCHSFSIVFAFQV